MAQNQSKQQGKAQEPDLNQLRKVRREKLAELVAEGKNPFEIVTYDQTQHSQEIKDNYAAFEGKEVSVAGRLMSKRVMGKASFGHIQDLQGTIQIYASRDDLGEDYKAFKRLDIGDIIGVKGIVFTTKMGEISIPDSSGEVPRPDQHRPSLSPALCRPHHEPGIQGRVR